MLVLCLTRCPPSLRGDITRWLVELDTGVYAGNVSARVRDELWDRIVANVNDGRATLVYSARNEQKMEFRVHNTEWTPVDFDGLTLMMRPKIKPGQTVNTQHQRTASSNAQAMLNAKKFSPRIRAAQTTTASYAVIDIETTGLSFVNDRIIELGAITVENGEVKGKFNKLIKCGRHIPEKITELTGITDEMLASEGVDEADALSALFAFVGDMSIVMHNAAFDMNFIAQTCCRAALEMPTNNVTDTMTLAKRTLDDVDDFKLTTLAAYFSLNVPTAHRSLSDCLTTKQVYDKLIEIR